MTTLNSGMPTLAIPLCVPTHLMAMWMANNQNTPVEEPKEAPVATVDTQATKFETASIAAVAIDGEQNDLLDALTRDASVEEAHEQPSRSTPPPFFTKAVNRAKRKQPRK